jgi:hypothetical protein
LKNSKVLVYNIDWSLNEKEIEINLNNGYPILYITQLKNNNLIACDPINVYFYSLGKFKSKLICRPNMNDKVKKVVQLSDKENLIVCEDSIKIIEEKDEKNHKYEIKDLKLGKYNNLIISSNRIVVTNLNRIEIYEYNNKKLINIDNIEFNAIDSIYSLIYFDNIVVALGKDKFYLFDIKSLDSEEHPHQINTLSHIRKIDMNSFLIWNDFGNIIYYEYNKYNENQLKYNDMKYNENLLIYNDMESNENQLNNNMKFNENQLKYNNMKFNENQLFYINTKQITSIIKLDDGSLIITNDSIGNKKKKKIMEKKKMEKNVP